MEYRQTLEEIVTQARPDQGAIASRELALRESLLTGSKDLDGANFTRLSPEVLRRSFEIYDRVVFDGACQKVLAANRWPIEFNLSKRMTRTGGMTVRYEEPTRLGLKKKTRFEIKLSATLLFQSFQDGRQFRVSGRDCSDRLDALLRIMEHEMIHLIEMMLWYDSSCSRKRFQAIASRLFGHTESTHQLMTPIEAARDRYGFLPGDLVTFSYEGKQLAGKVNRITRRATILVPDKRGERYNDGRRYLKFYVPLSAIRPITPR